MVDIVNVPNFLISIRETGYRSFAHTIAELVDNSLQAGATHVSVRVDNTGTGQIAVVDNGAGISRDALRTALQFGGTSRFGDRTGSGRFGMGLPTSSVTLAKRIDLYTWNGATTWHAYLDLDELQQCRHARITEPGRIRKCPLPISTPHGTAVVLTRVDRDGNAHDPGHLVQAKFELSRIFRYPLARDSLFHQRNSEGEGIGGAPARNGQE